MAHVYVGVVTYNSADDIIPCLHLLHKQDYPHLSVIVLDNASSDDTVHLVQSHFPDVQFIQNDANIGFGRGHNRIIAQLNFTSNDYYMSLNPDVMLGPEYISHLVETLHTHHADWGTGKLLLPDEQHIYSVGHALLKSGYAFNIGHALLDGEQFNTAREIFGAAGAAALYSMRLFEHQPLFDPKMFLYYEDVDLDWRAQRAGFRCWYCADAVATHRGSSPSVALRVGAVVNRYRSVFKNACISHLIVFNLPIIFAHTLIRIVFTPRLGLNLLRNLVAESRVLLERPASTTGACRRMRHWFAWSGQQPSGMPRSLYERGISFWGLHHQKNRPTNPQQPQK